METMTISRAARQARVGIETIRFYERRGLIEQPLKPRDGGYRDYPVETIQKICFIRQAQEIGFSLRETKELLALRAAPGTDCADVRKQASEKLEEVERKIGQLKKMGTALKTVIAACPSSGQLDGCSIIEMLENPDP
ncbi:MAG TPA: MerR family transcriptional regulator [Rhodospirillales bacterium]|nr:MerR family transcriptional regulator [Rhodospirillales bacterium]